MSVELLPAIEGGRHQGCMNCPPVRDTFAPDDRIGVGFGEAYLSRDGVPVWREDCAGDWDDLMSGEEAERMAAADPDHDWRIVLYGPLRGRTYQRHGKGEWVLVEKNNGFA